MEQCPPVSPARFYGVTILLKQNDQDKKYAIELGQRWDYCRVGNVLFTHTVLRHWLKDQHNVDIGPSDEISFTALDHDMKPLELCSGESVLLTSDLKTPYVIRPLTIESNLPVIETKDSDQVRSPGWTVACTSASRKD